MKKSLLIILFSTLFFNYLYGQVPAGYYDGTNGLTGEQLKSQLHNIIKNHTVKSYAEVKDVLRDIDEDPNNSNNVLLIYSRKSIPKSDFASNNEADFWNREHTWPKSHGFPDEQDTAYTDVHHLRPCDATINTSRSNKDFNNVEHVAENEEGESPNTYTTSDFWEPTEEVKGDLARTMFYMATRYNSESLDLELVNRISHSGDPELGVLFTLLQWHENDPVNQAEIDRNDGAYEYQGNRNPFIDNPSWIASIWGLSTDPLVLVDQESFNTDFGIVAAGSDLVQQYSITEYNLVGDITITVNTPFALSLDNTNWSQSLDVVKGSISPSEKIIYIKFAPTTENGNSYESSVVHQSNGAADAIFNITGTEGTTPLITIADARNLPLNDVVKVTGVVISKGNNSSNSRVIFDGTAGIVVRSFDAANESAPLNYGDSILVSGGLSEYNNLLQIENSPITITLLKENAVVPAAQIITIDAINESYESELITVEDVEIIESGVFAGGGSAGNFTIKGGQNILAVLRIGSSSHPLVGTPIPSGKVTITGIVGQYRTDYQLSPRDIEDIVIGDRVTGLLQTINNITIYPNPSYGIVHVQGIKSSLSNYSIIITNHVGRTISKEFIITNNQIDLSNFSSGIYFINFIHNDENFMFRFIKK